LLNEVLWNLDWMLTMQDPDDGGVYHKLTDLRFDGMQLPHHSKTERYVVMKTTAAALDFAAVMAQASRVFKAFEVQRPGLSSRALKAAQDAWAWAKAHPDVRYRQPADVRTGAYGDEDLRDEFFWAAAELFVSTGDAGYLPTPQHLPPKVPVPSWNEVAALGWMTLAHHRSLLPDAPGPFSLAKQVPARITALAQELADDWQTSPYRTTLRRSDFVWGSNAVVMNQAMMLLQGHELTGERRMLDAAQSALDYVLGRNATNLSQVTGVGSNPAKHPHHRPSAGYGKAVPGFLVGGPNPNLQDKAQCPAYPSTEVAKAYLDHVCSYASNEIAINWNAPLVYVSAALEALTPPPVKK
jgi:endoglucanase